MLSGTSSPAARAHAGEMLARTQEELPAASRVKAGALPDTQRQKALAI